MARQDLNAVFPRPELEHSWEAPGLTKREYFAAMAMQGFITSQQHCHMCARTEQSTAKIAVLHADALLARLEADNGD